AFLSRSIRVECVPGSGVIKEMRRLVIMRTSEETEGVDDCGCASAVLKLDRPFAIGVRVACSRRDGDVDPVRLVAQSHISTAAVRCDADNAQSGNEKTDGSGGAANRRSNFHLQVRTGVNDREASGLRVLLRYFALKLQSRGRPRWLSRTLIKSLVSVVASRRCQT